MLVKFRPFDELMEVPRTLRLFEDAVSQLFHEGAAARPWAPPVDIYETENELVLKVDAPEMNPADIEVQFENGTLTVKGKREFNKNEQGKAYHRMERSFGSFTRAFTLPETVDPEKLAAEYQNGVLTITIGKKEIAKPRMVKVNVHAN